MKSHHLFENTIMTGYKRRLSRQPVGFLAMTIFLLDSSTAPPCFLVCLCDSRRRTRQQTKAMTGAALGMTLSFILTNYAQYRLFHSTRQSITIQDKSFSLLFKIYLCACVHIHKHDCCKLIFYGKKSA